MKNKEILSSDRELPEKAKEWLKNTQAQIWTEGETDTERQYIYSILLPLHLKLKSLLRQSNCPISSFRASHSVRSLEASVACLNISDDVFLELIWNDIYTIDELEHNLGSWKSSLVPRGIESCEAIVSEVEKALEDWGFEKQVKPTSK